MLKEERKRNIVERAWAHDIRAEMWEAVFLRGKLKVIGKTIESLKEDTDRSGQEVRMLRSWLSLIKAHMGLGDTRLRHA